MIETIAIIPAYNEAERVGNVVRAALRADSVDAVIMVDDGSDDSTIQRAIDARELEPLANKPFDLVTHEHNKGKTEALRTGVEHARHLGSNTLKFLVFLDADSSPIWSRDTKANMKVWQLVIHSLSGTLQEPLQSEVVKGREDAFIGLLSRYIDEIVEPVHSEREVMRMGMYQRNVFTDTLLTLVGWGGHAGNRALPVELWDGLLSEASSRGTHLDRWEIEGAINAYAQGQACKQGIFMMHGVVNVGSRVKAGSMHAGLSRMAHIHKQAFRGMAKLRSLAK